MTFIRYDIAGRLAKVAKFAAPVFLLPLVGGAQDLTYFSQALQQVANIIKLAVPVLIALALLLFIWGLVVFIMHTDSEQDRQAGRQKMIWGVITLFVIVSVWGLVQLLQIIFGVDGDMGNIEPPGVPGM